MKTNMSTADRVIRLTITAAILILFYTGVVKGTIATVGLVIAGIFFLTSVFGYCPLYALFGISSKKEAPKA